MEKFNVVVSFCSGTVIEIEAENEEQAKAKAIEQIEQCTETDMQAKLLADDFEFTAEIMD